MGALALDASVVIGLLDTADAHHSRAVRELDRRLLPDVQLSMVATAYAEVLLRPLRDGRGDVVDRFVRESQMTLVPVDRDVARAATELRVRHRSLRFADALVLAAARVHDAELLTFDDRLRRLARR
jgi:predicted nucleic acid-binding protein